MFSRPKFLFLVSLLFVALLNPKFNPYLPFKFLIFYYSSVIIGMDYWAELLCIFKGVYTSYLFYASYLIKPSKLAVHWALSPCFWSHTV